MRKLNYTIPLLFSLVMLFGMFVGAKFKTSYNPDINPKDKIGEILQLIDDNYVDEPDHAKLTDAAITGILKELDPHSVYIPATEVQASKEELQGNFEGIGIEFNILNDTIIVVSPISGGPSEQLGIRAGDRIIAIDDKNVAGVGFKNEDVFKHLRGRKGTKVKVKIQRPGEPKPLEFVITRDRIPIYSVDASYMAAPGIGYIKVNRFSGTTMEELHSAFAKLMPKGMKSVILDLRGNPGGYLSAAVNMADEFLGGEKLVVYTDGRKRRKEVYNTRYRGAFESGKVAVLIDEGSASASEIVSGALQDWDRAVIIGRRSFGKGLVQEPIEMSDGSELRLTIARYYTPSKRSIQRSYKKGVDDYMDDFSHRIEHGELFSADSSRKGLDTVKYYTAGGRLVYGGGGIMPDYFIPLDTAENSKYLTSLLNKGVFNEFVFRYMDRNRKELNKKYPNFEAFNSGFEVDKKILNDFVTYGESKGVKRDAKGLEVSGDYIRVQIKALLARQLFHNDGYFEVMNTKNESFKKALQILQDGTYDKMKIKY